MPHSQELIWKTYRNGLCLTKLSINYHFTTGQRSCNMREGPSIKPCWPSPWVKVSDESPGGSRTWSHACLVMWKAFHTSAFISLFMLIGAFRGNLHPLKGSEWKDPGGQSPLLTWRMCLRKDISCPTNFSSCLNTETDEE